VAFNVLDGTVISQCMARAITIENSFALSNRTRPSRRPALRRTRTRRHAPNLLQDFKGFLP
jgi:hypothetical protein